MGIGEALGDLVGHAGASAGQGPFSRASVYVGNRHFPNLVPSIPEIFWAFRSGWMDAETAERLLRSQGMAWTFTDDKTGHLQTDTEKYLAAVWNHVYASQQIQPSPGELLQLLNRPQLTQYLTGNFVNEAGVDLSLNRQGFADPLTRKFMMSLRHEIPGPSDLVRFAVRHVFEPDLLQALGYNAEYREQFGLWLGQQGYAYPVPGLRSAPNDPMDKTWSHAFWWSHWILPSAGQGYTMLQRLRPTGGPRGGPRDPSGEVFDSATLNLLLRANDYPPFWRGKLTAISYRLPGLRQLTQLVDAGLTNRADLIERWQDLGYNLENATLLSDLTIKRSKIRKHKAEIGGVRGKVLAAYDLGLYSRAGAAVALWQAQQEDPDQLAAFAVLPAAQQEATAQAEPGILLALQGADVARSTGLVKAAIASVRKAYLMGRKSADECRAQLGKLGIQDQAIEEYLSLWSIQLDPERKALTIAKVMHLFRIGLLPALAAKRRVERMGYNTDDAQLLLSEAEKDVAADQAKSAVLAARTLAQRQAALERLVKAQGAAHNRARSELARHGTPSQLMRWYILGYLDDARYLSRLKFLDWPLLDAETSLAEAQTKRAAYVAKQKTPPVAPVTPPTGTAGNGAAPGVPVPALP